MQDEVYNWAYNEHHHKRIQIVDKETIEQEARPNSIMLCRSLFGFG